MQSEYTGSVPLDLTINKVGEGGVTGLSPTVALRDTSVSGRYLDFADNTFKLLGWVTKYAPLIEGERGHYQAVVDLSAVAPALTPGMVLAAEYHVDDGGDNVGDSLETIELVQTNTLLTLLRKVVTNRMEEVSGNPGSNTLFDDDDLTPILTWPLRDEFGNAVSPTMGSPARRGRAT